MKKQTNTSPARTLNAVAAILTATFASTAMATNFWWTGKESRNYGTESNWALNNTGTSVAASIPGSSDAVRFMAMNGSTSVFSDRFKNDGYIVEFDGAYTTGYQFFFNTSGAKVTFKGTAGNAAFTYSRDAYNKNAVAGIGDGTDSTLRIEDMTYTHSYTNLVLGWTDAHKGGLEIASGAKVVVPTTAKFHDGIRIKRGYITVDGGEINAPNSIIQVARYDANDKTANSSVVGAFTNLNGTVTCKQFIVGAADIDTTNDRDNYAEFYQNGGTLAVSGNIVVAQGNRTMTSGKFIMDGGKVTTAATLYVGDTGLNCATGTAHLVVNNGEIGCKAMHIGKQSQGVVDIYGGTVICTNECMLSSKTTYNATQAGYIESDAEMTPTLNLLGGVLQSPKMYSASTNSYATVFFNGGTLREGANNANLIENSARLHVKVGAKGGTIDTNGYTAKLHKTLETGVDAGTDGGMTFTGGGTLALQSTASLAYTGDTKVSSDTTLSVTDKSKVDLDKFICLVNSKPEENGHAILTTTGNDVFTAADLAKIRLVDGIHSAASVRLKLSADNKSILCKRSNGLIISFH